MNTYFYIAWRSWALPLLFMATAAHSASVSEQEAVATAEWWHAAEINAATTALPPAEKQARVSGRNKHAVSYILGRDNWQRTRKATDAVAAYVIAFEPSGFVVVSGEEALQPVLVFNATGFFQWDGPGRNYISHYLGRCVVGAVERVRSVGPGHLTHGNWTRIRGWLRNGKTQPAGSSGPSELGRLEPAPAGGTYVLWPTAFWDQGDHYNEVCVAHCGGIDVPTGCTATAMAIKMRYHEWPPLGVDQHSYNDRDGEVCYSHRVSFAVSYNWSAMPTNSLTADNADVATLMYHCGVAVEMDYERGGSGAWPSDDAMNEFFRYRGTTENDSGTPSDHVAGIRESVLCGLPTIMSSEDHTVVVSGYRDTLAPFFYLNGGHNGSDNGWYDLDQLVWGDDRTIDRSYPYGCPENYVYADAGAASFGTGLPQSPFWSLGVACSEVPDEGQLWIKGGTYRGGANVPITFNTPMTIKAYAGAVTIGP